MIGPARTDESFLADKATQDWAVIMTRASTVAPVNIDSLLCGWNYLARHGSGDVIFPQDAFCVGHALPNASARPVIAVLLPDKDDRLPAEEVHVLATRYAALAIEKECDVVILTHQHNAGFERFGFRVERLAGTTQAEQDACIAQLRLFWGFEIVV